MLYESAVLDLIALNNFIAICNKIIASEKVTHRDLNKSMGHLKLNLVETHLCHTVIYVTELKEHTWHVFQKDSRSLSDSGTL